MKHKKQKHPASDVICCFFVCVFEINCIFFGQLHKHGGDPQLCDRDGKLSACFQFKTFSYSSCDTDTRAHATTNVQPRI